jgi:hypothetical protein
MKRTINAAPILAVIPIPALPSEIHDRGADVDQPRLPG